MIFIPNFMKIPQFLEIFLPPLKDTLTHGHDDVIRLLI
jgi:hypothetical protein